MAREKHILLAFDVPGKTSSDPRLLRDTLALPEWEDERHIFAALRRRNPEVSAIGVGSDVAELVQIVDRLQPDVVFNCCETFASRRELEPSLPSLLDMLGVPYTGCRPHNLSLCKDKAATKKILTYHGVPTPRFLIAHRGHDVTNFAGVTFPCIVKPLNLEASEGLSQRSLVVNVRAARARIHEIHARWQTDALVEEFVTGRELYVGMMGRAPEEPEIFPPVEIRFGTKREASGTDFLTYRAKWDDAYRRRRRIHVTTRVRLSPKARANLETACRTTFAALGLRGFARLDLRLSVDDQISVLEVNPNPGISRSEEFVRGARAYGLTYDALISRLVDLGLEMGPAHPRAAA